MREGLTGKELEKAVMKFSKEVLVRWICKKSMWSRSGILHELGSIQYDIASEKCEMKVDELEKKREQSNNIWEHIKITDEICEEHERLNRLFNRLYPQYTERISHGDNREKSNDSNGV
jgi:hypothetical protein